jgi:hypothetical protein
MKGSAMQTVIAAEVAVRAQDPTTSARPGSILRQNLLADTAPDGLSFRLIRSQYQQGELAFETPRHHHTFQQVRWTEAGSVNYAPDQDIPEGSLAYFPRGAYYGPQRKDQGIALLLQYGLGGEFLHRHHQRGHDAEHVLNELRASGTFTGGQYIDTDPDTGRRRYRDAVQAIYDARSGGDVTIPPAGYETPILIHPAAFSYYTAAQGLEIKPLGNFYDHPGPHGDLRIRLVRLTDDATFVFTADRAQIAWTTADGLRIGGQSHPALTCLYSPRGEADSITGTGGVELVVLDMPRLN